MNATLNPIVYQTRNLNSEVRSQISRTHERFMERRLRRKRFCAQNTSIKGLLFKIAVIATAALSFYLINM